MGLLSGFLEIAGVFVALCAWGLIPDLPWEYDYKLCAGAAFLLIPEAGTPPGALLDSGRKL